MEPAKIVLDCEDCEEPIPSARLQANPKTTRCVTCQEVAEKSGKFQRHTMTQKVEFSKDGAEVESSTNVLIRGSK